jgi:hypothetical protein
MKLNRLIAVAVLIFLPFRLSAEQAYHFKFCILAGVSRSAAKSNPASGVREIKLLPMRPKEYIYPSAYFSFTKNIKNTEAAVQLAALPAKDSRNSAILSEAVFKYIRDNIQEQKSERIISDDFHKGRKTGMEVLESKCADNLERCRAAVCLLRYYTIPARIVFYNGDYAVEYFLKPLKSAGKWIVSPFAGKSAADGFADPVEWEPVTGKELLNEEIRKGSALLERGSCVEQSILNRAEAEAKFVSITAGTAVLEPNDRLKGKFFIIRETGYSISLTATASAHVKIDFMLPYNDRDMFDQSESGFKTGRFFVTSADPALKIKYKKPSVKKNPPQEGIVYYLPVEFWTE